MSDGPTTIFDYSAGMLPADSRPVTFRIDYHADREPILLVRKVDYDDLSAKLDEMKAALKECMDHHFYPDPEMTREKWLPIWRRWCALVGMAVGDDG